MLKAVLENDTHKLLWDFDIQTDHLIAARRTDFIIINKKKRICKIVGFAVPADYRIKLKKDKYLDFAKELKKLWKVTIMPIVIGAFGTVTKGLLKGLEDLEIGGLGSWRTSGNYPNYIIIENGQNPEESSGDLKRLAVTQTPGKDHRLKLMWKTLMSEW